MQAPVGKNVIVDSERICVNYNFSTKLKILTPFFNILFYKCCYIRTTKLSESSYRE